MGKKVFVHSFSERTGVFNHGIMSGIIEVLEIWISVVADISVN